MHLKINIPFFIFVLVFEVLFNFTIKSQSIDNKDSTYIHNDTTVNNDTINNNAVKNNSIYSNDAIDKTIIYSARDSISFDMNKEYIYLFGDVSIKYGNIHLSSGYMEIDLGKQQVYATGALDSNGKMNGYPIFTESNQPYMAKEMYYNFETKKGRIIQAITQQGQSYVHGDIIKKHPNEEIHIKGGKFTTCNLEHPHFYIKSSKLKIIPEDKIIAGPSYLVIEDIPTPLMLPFGFFPNKKGAKSGILLPEYGETKAMGFFLHNAGYFWAVNDYMNLIFTGDVYSNGSWATHAQSMYTKRYKYSGNIKVDYSILRFGDPQIEETFQKNSSFFVKWNHKQDAKANPNSRFSANVNGGSSNYQTYNAVSTGDYLANTFMSSIAYQKTFAGTPFNMSLNLRHSQNTKNQTVKLNLPELALNMNRLYFNELLFGKQIQKHTTLNKFLKKFSVSANMNARNEISTIDSMLFESTWQDFKNGMRFNVPINGKFKLSHFNISSTLTLTERFYFNSINKSWDYQNNLINIDTITGFTDAFDYNFSTNISTKIYSMLQLTKGKIKAIRHVLTPSMALSYRPDFSEPEWGYYNMSYSSLGNNTYYPIHELGIYGYPPKGAQKNVSFNLSNNLEMKVRTPKDSVNPVKKVKLIENLTASANYNFAGEEFKLSNINISGRTQLFKRIDVRYRTVYDPYIIKIDTVTGQIERIDKLEWDEYKRIARKENASWDVSLNFTLGPKKTKKKPIISPNEDVTEEELKMVKTHPEGYVDFDIPWRLNISYIVRYGREYFYSGMYDPDSIQKSFVQTLRFSGDVNLTPKWKIGFNSGYDFEHKKMSYTSFDIYRDLHCWELRFEWVPFGYRQRYSVDLKVKSSLLQDLKLSRKKDWYDAYQP